jgi:hypothetical protein
MKIINIDKHLCPIRRVKDPTLKQRKMMYFHNDKPYSLPVRVRELDIAVSVWPKLHIADVPMQNHKNIY